MYPNPANNYVQIEPEFSGTEYVVSITNGIGQLVKTETINNNSNTISVEGLSKGIYTVAVQDNKSRSVSKLIID